MSRMITLEVGVIETGEADGLNMEINVHMFSLFILALLFWIDIHIFYNGFYTSEIISQINNVLIHNW